MAEGFFFAIETLVLLSFTALLDSSIFIACFGGGYGVWYIVVGTSQGRGEFLYCAG